MPFWIAVTAREHNRPWFLHHIRARKHLAGFFIAPSACELRIDDGIFNRGMAHPVLDKPEIRAGVEEVCGNRMFEDVEMAFVFGYPRKGTATVNRGEWLMV
jgi:hypothetical protein